MCSGGGLWPHCQNYFICLARAQAARRKALTRQEKKEKKEGQ